MPVSRKDTDAEVEVTFYDAATAARPVSSSDVAKKYSAKETVNLFMKDRKDISFELFFLLLAIILILLLAVEYFFAYMPYRRLEQAEADLRADQTRLERLDVPDDEFERVENDYLKYNYEHFDKTIADREDVLDMLGETAFKYGKATSVDITGNTVRLNLSGVPSDKVETLQTEMREHKRVNDVFVTNVKMENSLADVSLTVLLNDATKVKED